ncbi:MAG TPA: hypothetical protein VIY08_02865, partial [Candidatus Nitrosocosmicus sp.]
EPFHYPNTFLLLLGYAKAYFHLPYRQTKEGILQVMPKESYHQFQILQLFAKKNKQISYQNKKYKE